MSYAMVKGSQSFRFDIAHGQVSKGQYGLNVRLLEAVMFQLGQAGY